MLHLRPTGWDIAAIGASLVFSGVGLTMRPMVSMGVMGQRRFWSRRRGILQPRRVDRMIGQQKPMIDAGRRRKERQPDDQQDGRPTVEKPAQRPVKALPLRHHHEIVFQS